MTEIGNKKSTLLDSIRVVSCTSKRLVSKHTFLSLVGQTVVQNRQFSWLCFLAPPAFPILLNQWLSVGFTLHYSGGTVPVFHRSSLLSPCGHLSSYEILLLSNRCLTNKKLFARTQRDIYKTSPSHRSWVKRWYKIGSSPDSTSSLSCLPDFSVTFPGFAPYYSGGTVPASHRSSLLSPHGHLSFHIRLNI